MNSVFVTNTIPNVDNSHELLNRHLITSLSRCIRASGSTTLPTSTSSSSFGVVRDSLAMPSSSPPIHLHRQSHAQLAYVCTLKSENASKFVLSQTNKTKMKMKIKSKSKSKHNAQIKQLMMSAPHKVNVGQLTNKMKQYKMTLHKLNKVVTSQKLKLQTMESKRNKMKLRHRDQLKQKQEQIDALLMERELLRKQISDSSSGSSSNEDEHEQPPHGHKSKAATRASPARRIAPTRFVVDLEHNVNVLCADRLTSDEEQEEEDTVMAPRKHDDDVIYRLQTEREKQQEKIHEYEQQLKLKQGEIEKYRLLMEEQQRANDETDTVNDRHMEKILKLDSNDTAKQSIEPRCVPNSIHSILSLLLGG